MNQRTKDRIQIFGWAVLLVVMTLVGLLLIGINIPTTVTGHDIF